MLAFWQNHPSLSYLFSGRFIGPTSQHPRIDEARMDALYELEIAFTQLPEGECPPWLVDRLFRNLLVDMTGNTHRAEFCIDKLYPPRRRRLTSGPAGAARLRDGARRPHVSRRASANPGNRGHVLEAVRTKAAWFAGAPRSMIVFCCPTSSGRTSATYLRSFSDSDTSSSERWFESHLEFRFPKLGSVSADGIQLELRQALEPWHVLGEDASGGGTARSVDSSLDRLQVKVSGLTPDSRYVVACNGRKVPLHSTGVPGEAVAGVRYRAWLPTSESASHHPGPHAADFDLVDTWNDRADRRMPLACAASRRSNLLRATRKRCRGREPPPRTLQRLRPHTRAAWSSTTNHPTQPFQ